ncbi:MAG: hypothetical protein V3U11_04170 [Planctomycetota bacterium]
MPASQAVSQILALSLLATASAQGKPTAVTAKLVTVNQLKVVANAPSGNVTKTTPAKTDISRPFSLEAFPPKLESSAFFISLLEGGAATGWRLTIRDGGNTTGTATASAGTNTVMLNLTSNRSQMVNVSVTLRSSVFGTGAVHSALVDINNDGKVEVTGTQTAFLLKQFTRTMGVGVTPIRISTSGATPGQNQQRRGFGGIITVEVRPISACSATSYGIGCLAGAKLSGRMTWDHEMELHMQWALGNTPAVLAIGTKQINVPLPTVLPSCLLHTDVLAVVFTRTNATGVATVKVPIPKNLKATANAQMFTVRQPTPGFLDIRSTNGLRVTCK